MSRFCFRSPRLILEKRRCRIVFPLIWSVKECYPLLFYSPPREPITASSRLFASGLVVQLSIAEIRTRPLGMSPFFYPAQRWMSRMDLFVSLPPHLKPVVFPGLPYLVLQAFAFSAYVSMILTVKERILLAHTFDKLVELLDSFGQLDLVFSLSSLLVPLYFRRCPSLFRRTYA